MDEQNIYQLNTSGLACPLPVLKLRKALKSLATGEQIACISTDPASLRDVQDFCRASGHILIKQIQKNNDGNSHNGELEITHIIEKGVPS